MLTAKQKKFIPEYLKTGSIKEACNKVKISEITYQNWRNDSEFMAELKKQQDKLYNDSLDKLKTLSDSAINTLKRLLDSNNEAIKLRAANAILDNTFKFVESKDLKERIEALEELIKDKETTE